MNETLRNFALWLTGTVMLVTLVGLIQRLVHGYSSSVICEG